MPCSRLSGRARTWTQGHPVPKFILPVALSAALYCVSAVSRCQDALSVSVAAFGVLCVCPQGGRSSSAEFPVLLLIL